MDYHYVVLARFSHGRLKAMYESDLSELHLSINCNQCPIHPEFGEIVEVLYAEKYYAHHDAMNRVRFVNKKKRAWRQDLAAGDSSRPQFPKTIAGIWRPCNFDDQSLPDG